MSEMEPDRRVGRGVDAGPRLDRLPPAAFHRRIVVLIGTGMFLDACDIYLAPGVLGAPVKSGWSDVVTNAWFLSATFAGMLIGTLSSGFVLSTVMETAETVLATLKATH